MMFTNTAYANAHLLREMSLAGTRIIHELLQLQTRSSSEFMDITPRIEKLVCLSGITDGFVNIQSRHTTAAIIINENEPLLLDDIKRVLERLAPRHEPYRHDDFSIRTENMTAHEKPNGHAHCKAMFLRTAEMLNIADGKLQLGQWQRIFLVELDCARAREISVLILGQ
jgi:secondary thiamine-phosphate synthase enzyme